MPSTVTPITGDLDPASQQLEIGQVVAFPDCRGNGLASCGYLTGVELLLRLRTQVHRLPDIATARGKQSEPDKSDKRSRT